MKYKKIKLEKFKVKSFVTAVGNGWSETIKGGVTGENGCQSGNPTCASAQTCETNHVTCVTTTTTTTIDTMNAECLIDGGQSQQVSCEW